MKIQFILKRNSYGYNSYNNASGLFNSTRFIVEMLMSAGVDAELVVVNDNNDIDREVTRFRPDIVVIEALWVVPEKFDVLKPLHLDVVWIVRLHSDIPFLAGEGIAIEWIRGYLERDVYVGLNKERTFQDFEKLADGNNHLLYLPNWYPVWHCQPDRDPFPGLNIGCFGAIRPLKNQLIQAVAAIEYADRTDQNLSFFVNSTRVEQGGDSVRKNLRALFENTPHSLVEVSWLTHQDFLSMVAKMNLAMAVSFTETFCITAADAVNMGVPLVCSDQVPWADSRSIVSTTDTNEMSVRVQKLINHPWLSNVLNRRRLRKFSKKSRKIWLETLDELFASTLESWT